MQSDDDDEIQRNITLRRVRILRVMLGAAKGIIMKIRLMVSTILPILIACLLIGCGASPAEQIRGQLEYLDQNSYGALKEWLASEFEEFEDFTLAKRAIGEEGSYLYSGFLNDEERFIRWDFNVYEEKKELFIEIIYEEVNFVAKLEDLDQDSMEEILEWIEIVEELGRDSGISLLITAVDIDGNALGTDIVDMANEDLFIEWTFHADTIGREVEVDIELEFDAIRRFSLGETFEHDGLEITFEDGMSWGMVEDSQSQDFGVEFFKVPVTLSNLSDRTRRNFFPSLFAPDGIQLDLINVDGADDDIIHMRELGSGETQSGYLYIRFEDDGDYTVTLRDGSITAKVTIPMDSSEFQEERDALLDSLFDSLLGDLLAELDIDFEPVEAEDLIGRWVDGEGAIPLFVFGTAEIIEFRTDGTVLIIDDGFTFTESWELDEFGILHVRSFEFLVFVEDDFLFLIDEWDDIRDWVRE